MSGGFFKRSTFEPHPEGVTIGTLVNSEPDTTGKFGPQIKLQFDTEELMDDDRPFRVTYWLSQSFNPKSNTYKFFKACGVDVDSLTDEGISALDPDDYLNHKFQLVITHVKTADGGTAAKVANILPARTKKPRPAAAVAPPPRTPEPVGAAAGTAAGLWADDDDDQ